MINASKYKVAGSALGICGGCYGTYEIYNHFCKDLSVNKKSMGNNGIVVQSAEEQQLNPIVEDIKEHVDNEEENIPSNEESVEEANEEQPNPPEQPEETKPEPVDMSESTSPPNEPSTPNHITTSVSNNFSNSNESIKIKEGTIGSRFKDQILTSTSDEGVWKEKVALWNHDIQYHKARKNYMHTMPKEFTLKSWEKLENKELQRRCSNAYGKRTWDDLSTSLIPHNKFTRVREYWAMVWKYCGKPRQHMPFEWGSR